MGKGIAPFFLGCNLLQLEPDGKGIVPPFLGCRLVAYSRRRHEIPAFFLRSNAVQCWPARSLNLSWSCRRVFHT